MADIWAEMMALERRMDEMFRSLFGTRARFEFPALREGIKRPFVPATDVYKKEGNLIVALELPGIEMKDVTVTLEDGELVVRGERKASKEITEEDYYRLETSYGSFERHIPVPERTKEDDVKASYRNGILEIALPVAEEKEPEKPLKGGKQIPIQIAA